MFKGSPLGGNLDDNPPSLRPPGAFKGSTLGGGGIVFDPATLPGLRPSGTLGGSPLGGGGVAADGAVPPSGFFSKRIRGPIALSSSLPLLLLRRSSCSGDIDGDGASSQLRPSKGSTSTISISEQASLFAPSSSGKSSTTDSSIPKSSSAAASARPGDSLTESFPAFAESPDFFASLSATVPWSSPSLVSRQSDASRISSTFPVEAPEGSVFGASGGTPGSEPLLLLRGRLSGGSGPRIAARGPPPALSNKAGMSSAASPSWGAPGGTGTLG
mmetsp:Transcript_56449/g.157359  ORF Transcript_56449/g.157359 Transcript_56449/m.157359 type:complete len:272 (-) Transcript_56449:483-1298(-)